MNKFWKNGDPFVWLTGVALMFSLLMIAGLMYLILAKGLIFFWPSDVAELDLKNGGKLMGEIITQEKVPSKADAITDEYRTQLKIGNRDLYGLDFKWVDDEEIESISYPKYAVVLERREWGNMYGFIKEITEDGQVISEGNEESWPILESLIPVYAKIAGEIKSIEKGDIGGINHQIENYRLKIRGLELKGEKSQALTREYESKIKEEEEKYKVEEKKLSVLYKEFNKDKIVMVSVDGREKEMSIGNIVRAFRPNSMNWFQKASLYTSRAWGFVSE
ncbi:MAG: phosphate ABC transporter, permease protein PstA, partial [Deltaproteobacteria bacterium]|nr:phosphate ABC transporter, permease protein PstA [Deltaproteobacteria bacterium]